MVCGSTNISLFGEAESMIAEVAVLHERGIIINVFSGSVWNLSVRVNSIN